MTQTAPGDCPQGVSLSPTAVETEDNLSRVSKVLASEPLLRLPHLRPERSGACTPTSARPPRPVEAHHQSRSDHRELADSSTPCLLRASPSQEELRLIWLLAGQAPTHALMPARDCHLIVPKWGIWVSAQSNFSASSARIARSCALGTVAQHHRTKREASPQLLPFRNRRLGWMALMLRTARAV
jgi:hypothetical protein